MKPSVDLADVASAVLAADALWRAGDWAGAEAGFEQAIALSGDELPETLAWRLGALLYLQGDRARSEAVLRRATRDAPDSADGALVAAWLSAALWRHGRTEEARECAERAQRIAYAVEDQAAIAAAEVARALVCAADGDRVGNLRAYRAGARAAAAAGDVIQMGRILGNLSSRALEEGDYDAAVRHADDAVQTAAVHRVIVAFCLENKTEALIRQGRLDPARAAAAESVAAYTDAGSVDVAGPELLLGEVYRLRGDRVQARLAFDRALLSAERGEDSHRLAAACAGLVWVTTSDPERASSFAERSLAHASALEMAAALNAASWAALVADQPARAREFSIRAEREALRTDDRAALATALELRAVSSDPTDMTLLEAAAAIRHEVGDAIAAARTDLAVATILNDRASAAEARAVLAEYGVPADVGVTGRVLTAQSPELVSILTFGRFAVLVEGQTVPATAWQSRKVRELLKVLAARSGRPISREAAADALWPGDPYDLAGPRLSVLLTRLRAILDPERSYPSNHYLDADKISIALRTDNLSLDVIDFFAEASRGIHLASQGRTDEATLALHRAEQLYVGDFLDDDSDADWAIDCRERARTASVTCARTLARIAASHGNDEEAARWLLRLIERDPYDEDAWTAVIAAHVRMRRHGEARQHHATYARRMAELDLPVEPFEQVSDRLP